MGPVIVGLLFALGIGVAAAASGSKKKPKAPKDLPQLPIVRGPDGRGWIFGKSFVESFAFMSNELHIDQDCANVMVGEKFWPEGGIPAGGSMHADTLDAALLIPGNTALGFIDYLLQVEGLTQPEQVAARILVEAAPMCADVPTSQWGPGLVAFYEWLMVRLNPYVDEWVRGIEAPEDEVA